MKRRSFSLFLVFVMVIAMAVACGNKEEASETDDAKTEASADETEDAQQEAEQPDDDVDASESVETEQLTEDELKENLRETIREAVISEYLTPNNIPIESFEWPNDDWSKQYIGSLIDLSLLSLSVGQEPNYDLLAERDVPAGFESQKELMDVTYNAILKWLEENKPEDDSEYYYENMIGLMSPPEEFVTSIDF